MSDPFADAPAYGGGPQVPARRPVTVTAGAVITIVLSGLTFLVAAVFGLSFLANRDQAVDRLEQQLRERNQAADITGSDLATIATVFLGIVVVWALVAIVLAVFTLRRRQWSRITLVVSSVVSAVFCLVGILAIIPVVPLAGAVATIVLLFTGGANQWFARRPV